MKLTNFAKYIPAALIAMTVLAAALWFKGFLEREKVLREVVARLSADTRVAEAIVTKSELDEKTGKVATTVKFLEYDAQNKPLAPKYFTFRGNVVQFQALVIRFKDELVRRGDKLKGKSVCLFTKAFMLDGANTQEFIITPMEGVPEGYKTSAKISKFESELWQKFWAYALDPAQRENSGVKSAQIEAPGSLFMTGTLYTLTIEHDGGIRIDTQPVPEILKGETIS